MESKEIKILWSNRAVKSLETIYDFYFELSEQGAENIRKDILKTVSNLLYVEQYQIDEINIEYRRMVVRHYKIIYKVTEKSILILNIFDTRQDPSKSKI